MLGESAQHVFPLCTHRPASVQPGETILKPYRGRQEMVECMRPEAGHYPVIKSSMLTCGMWAALSHSPDGGKGTLDVGCYFPRRGKVRQSVEVPHKLVPDKGGVLEVPWEGGFRKVRCVPGIMSVLCEEAILLFTVYSRSSNKTSQPT